ncbi:MAG: hypothetical protein AAB365_00480 [Patescibacteria group bacterium]
MNTKTLTPRALSVIDQYLHFTVGSASCSIPYFNNKTVLARGALRVNAGKGSPHDILDEVQTIIIKSHVSIAALTGDALKKVLTDENIGIDCSGFAYYILNAESLELKKGVLGKRISFVRCTGFMAKLRSTLRPIENCDVATLAHDDNSAIVAIKDILPGDIITMLDNTEEGERDHVLVIHQVAYQESAPVKIYYSHAVAYPEDGLYGSGIKQGTIEIADVNQPLTDAVWTENGKQGDANRIFLRAKKSKTEIRRVR